MDLKVAIEGLSFLVVFGGMAGGLIAWFTRATAESAIQKKVSEVLDRMELLGARLMERVDAIKIDLSDISGTLRVIEERHVNVTRDVDRLGSRVEKIESTPGVKWFRGARVSDDQ